MEKQLCNVVCEFIFLLVRVGDCCLLGDSLFGNMEPRGGVTIDFYRGVDELATVLVTKADTPDLVDSVEVSLAKLVTVFLGA